MRSNAGTTARACIRKREHGMWRGAAVRTVIDALDSLERCAACLDANCSVTALIWPYASEWNKWRRGKRTVLTDWTPHMSFVVRMLSLCGVHMFMGISTHVHAER